MRGRGEQCGGENRLGGELPRCVGITAVDGPAMPDSDGLGHAALASVSKRTLAFGDGCPVRGSSVGGSGVRSIEGGSK